jgi:hypothetical protein
VIFGKLVSSDRFSGRIFPHQHFGSLEKRALGILLEYWVLGTTIFIQQIF